MPSFQLSIDHRRDLGFWEVGTGRGLIRNWIDIGSTNKKKHCDFLSKDFSIVNLIFIRVYKLGGNQGNRTDLEDLVRQLIKKRGQTSVTYLQMIHIIKVKITEDVDD